MAALKQKQDAWHYSLLLFIPVATVVLAVFFMEARGPFYICTNLDPAYFYLNNSLNVAVGEWANHIDNPGSTVQLLGGLTIKLITLVKGVDDVEQEVLLHPEFYLTSINYVLIFLNVSVIFALGFFALQWTKNTWYSLLLQCAPFVSWQTFRVFVKVSPEPLSFFASILLTIVLLRLVQKKDLELKPGYYTFLFALIVGFGVATKLTFIPMLFIPLVILPGIRLKLMFMLATIAMFHLFIIPAYGHYDYFLTWIKDLFIHSGQYGGGAPEIIDFPAFFKNIATLLFLHHSFFALVAASAVVLVGVHFNQKLKPLFERDLHCKVLLAIAVATFFHTLLVAKHYNPHYMTPFFTLAPFLIFLLIEIVKKINAVHPLIPEARQARWMLMLITTMMFLIFFRHQVKYLPGHTLADWLQDILPALVILMVCTAAFALLTARLLAAGKPQPQIKRMLSSLLVALVVIYYLRDADLKSLYVRLEACKNDAREVTEFINRNYEGYVKIYCNNASSQLNALRLGASINIPQPERFKKLQSLYADHDVYFYHANYTTWTNAVPLDSIIRTRTDVILHGDSIGLNSTRLKNIEQQAHVNLKQVYTGALELVYEVERRQ